MRFFHTWRYAGAEILLAALLLLLPALAWSADKPEPEVITHTVAEGETLGSIASRYKVDIEVLMRLNGISDPRSLRKGQTLEIPPAGDGSGLTHKVLAGESLAEIAHHYGVGVQSLAEENDLKPDAPLKPGSALRIPNELRQGATRGHVIRKGDSIASIARHYGVSQKLLVRINDIRSSKDLKVGRTLAIPEPGADEEDDGPDRPLPHPKAVVSGTKVNGGVEHILQPGQNFWTLSRAYGVPVARIRQANRQGQGAMLRPGEKIFVPGASEVVAVPVGKWTYLPIHFVRNATREEATFRLLNDRGKVIPAGRQKLSVLARCVKAKKIKPLHTRLIRLIQRVADRYPGRTIEIISGYRKPKTWPPRSRHEFARALDFHVRGVPNKDLFEFVKTLPSAGAGFYPNSSFVHMDVRNENVVWCDLSGPGQKAQYGKMPSGAQEQEVDPEPEGNMEKSLPEAVEPDEDDRPESP